MTTAENTTCEKVNIPTKEVIDAQVIPSQCAEKIIPAVKASELRMNETVKNHAFDIIKSGPNKGELARPYVGTDGVNFIIDEIMAAAEPVADRYLKNGLKWEVAGRFKSDGIWELCVDLDTNMIVHFLFKSDGK